MRGGIRGPLAKAVPARTPARHGTSTADPASHDKPENHMDYLVVFLTVSFIATYALIVGRLLPKD